MKPGDFYIGVITFFAILVPGAIGVAVLRPVIGDRFDLLIDLPTGPAAEWAAFLVVAYALGHLIFLVGARLDTPYDKVKEHFRPFAKNSALQHTIKIREKIIERARDKNGPDKKELAGMPEIKAFNTFQWARAVLNLSFPAAAADVHELEADAKFFRSLVVVLVLCAIVFFSRGKSPEGLISLGLVIPCSWRYYERRIKSTAQAYTYVITLNGLDKFEAPTQTVSSNPAKSST